MCTDGLSSHSARAIAHVLGVHAAAVVGGIERTNGWAEPASPRDRLLTAASKLFHEVGIQAAGVDAIVAEAGVAEAIFYRDFPPRTTWLSRGRALIFGTISLAVARRSGAHVPAARDAAWPCRNRRSAPSICR